MVCNGIETGCPPESVRSVLTSEALRPKGRGRSTVLSVLKDFPVR